MKVPGSDQPTPYVVHDRLAVYRFGSGVPLLLMPGPHRFQKPGDRTADAMIAGLTQLGRQVITYDPPGSGRSTRPARIGMPEMHQCANEALDACDITGPVDAMGHSMGGLAVLAYALEHPQRVRRLMLVGTGTGGPAYMKAPGALWNSSHPAFWRTALIGILYTIWPRRAPETMMSNFIERYSYQDQSQVTHKEIRLSDWFRPLQGYGVEWNRVARKLEYSPRLGEIQVPALILCGRYDPQYPPACSQELATGIKNSQVIYFEHSGHYPFIEESQAFWQVVGEFLTNTA